MNRLLTLKNRLTEIESFQARLEKELSAADFTLDLIHDLCLVCEEVLVNIISYGYDSDGHPEKEIAVRLVIDADRKVHMEFSDDATPFDPLSVEERDPDDERIGGWGIPMLKTLTDRLEYSYEDGRNILRIERSERDS